MRPWISALAATLVLVVGCGADPGESLSDAIELEMYPADDPEWELVAELRAADVCALIPRAEFDRIGPGAVIGSAGSHLGCVGTVGKHEVDYTSVAWSLDSAELPRGDKGQEIELAGGAAWVVSDLDRGFTPEEIARRGVQGCTVWVELPPGGSAAVNVDAVPGADTCALASRAAATVRAGWPNRSRPGTGEGTIRTVLTEADPCAVIETLGIGRAGTSPGIAACAFRYRGERIVVRYEYDSGRPNSDSYPELRVAGRVGYRSEYDGRHTYTLPAGPRVVFPALSATSSRGQEVSAIPSVELSGKDQDVLVEVAEIVLALLD